MIYSSQEWEPGGNSCCMDLCFQNVRLLLVYKCFSWWLQNNKLFTHVYNCRTNNLTLCHTMNQQKGQSTNSNFGLCSKPLLSLALPASHGPSPISHVGFKRLSQCVDTSPESWLKSLNFQKILSVKRQQVTNLPGELEIVSFQGFFYDVCMAVTRLRFNRCEQVPGFVRHLLHNSRKVLLKTPNFGHLFECHRMHSFQALAWNLVHYIIPWYGLVQDGQKQA